MKKTILTIMATVCIMTIGCGIYVEGVKSNYETKLEEAVCEHETELGFIQDERLELMAECNELGKRVTELEDQVYNIMEHNDYDVTIEKDGVVHTYYKTKDGLFSDSGHTITTFN